jgi:glucose 1-dehydrogenase
MANLSGKVALITGSSQGIGRGCALEMAKAGADIVVNYRSHPEGAAQTVADVKKLGRKAIAVKADMCDASALESMAAQAIREFGKVDILVNNATYVAPRVPFWKLPKEEFEKLWRSYTMACFVLTSAIVRDMIEHKRKGKILLISSVHGFQPYPNCSAYNSSKGGGELLFLTMATELTPYKINVNIIQPGWIDTPGERVLASDKIIDEAGPHLPWKRMGQIEDIGKAATFLCSDDADYITGANLRVDGGLVLPRSVEHDKE